MATSERGSGMRDIGRHVVLIVLLLPIAELRAQWRPSPRRIDIGLGVGYGSGGPPRTDRWLLSGALLLSRSVHDLPRGALVVAGNVSANLTWRTSDCVGGDFGNCTGFPSDVSASLLAGWTTHTEQWSGVRLLAGPSFFSATNNRRGLGVTTRIDGARRLTSRIAFVVWAQGQVHPQLRGERLTIGTAGIGVRASRLVRIPRRDPEVPTRLPLPPEEMNEEATDEPAAPQNGSSGPHCWYPVEPGLVR